MEMRRSWTSFASRRVRWVAGLTGLLMVTQLLVSTPLPAEAASTHGGGIWTPPNTPNPSVTPVPTNPLTGGARQATVPSLPAYHAPTLSLPAAVTVAVSVPAPARPQVPAAGHSMAANPDALDAADLAAPVRVGTSPVLLRHVGSGVAVTGVSVEFAGAEAA